MSEEAAEPTESAADPTVEVAAQFTEAAEAPDTAADEAPDTAGAVDETTVEAAPGTARPRRRASRAAGPTGAPDSAVLATVPVATEPQAAAKKSRPRGVLAGPPPRRRANAPLVAMVAGAVGLVLVVAMAALIAVQSVQYRHAESALDRDQRFVDTATQSVVNLFSYHPDSISEGVDRFIAGTSGPLHDMMYRNAEALKSLYRDTHASAETVINAAALERVDAEAGNAAVLVAMRVTVTDIDGVNKPSQAYRLRMIVHEDENGDMTAYDLQYPKGGN